jgi:hypothetical protein
MTEPVDLRWFYPLDLSDRVSLLAKPGQQLSWAFARQHLLTLLIDLEVAQQVLDETVWNNQYSWKLQRPMALRLEQIRGQLDSVFTDADRAYLIEHHDDGGHPAEYVARAQAGAEEIGEPPEMVHTYIELKARPDAVTDLINWVRPLA